MKKKTQLLVVVVVALTLALGGLAYGAAMNATLSIGDGVVGSPDLLTATSISFNNSGAYTYNASTGMAYDTNGTIGGASASVNIANGAYSGGTGFLTWTIDPSGTADAVSFDATNEQIITRYSIGGSSAVTIYLTGVTNDAQGFYDPNNLSSLLLTVQDNGGSYSWTANWASPPVAPSTPEASTILLFGVGLALMATVTLRGRTGEERNSLLSC